MDKLWTGDDPVDPGWYATLHSWDSNEGAFPGAHFWNGKFWAIWMDGQHLHTKATLPIVWRSTPSFKDDTEAETWAYEHDPGF